MPYKKRQPVPESEMIKDRWKGHHTVCQTLRDIYAETQSDDIKMMCRLAMAMTKAMHERLKYYKAKEKENASTN